MLRRVQATESLEYTTSWELLVALKNRFKPTDRARELEVATKYARAKRYNKDMRVQDWLNKWENTYEEAKALNLPEVDGIRPQYDFFVAINAISPAFAANGLATIDERTERGEQIDTVITYINRFRNQYRLEESTNSKHNKINYSQSRSGRLYVIIRR